MSGPSGPTEHNERLNELDVNLPSEASFEAERLLVPQVEREVAFEPHALILGALHGPLDPSGEKLLCSALTNNSTLTATLEERALLACVAGVGTTESKTEAIMLQQLMSSSPNLAALAIGMRVIVEPHPDYSMAQRAALNYTSFLPAPLAKEILQMAVEKGASRDSWYRDAFDDSKKLEFAVECRRMANLMWPEAPLPRFERSSYLDVIGIVKNVDALCSEGISSSNMRMHIHAIGGLRDKELKAAALTLLLFTGNEEVVTYANELLLSEYPKLRALLGNDYSD